jgi:hypothetical protein
VKVFLEQTGKGRRFFHKDGPGTEDAPPLPSHPGLRGWFTRKLHALHNRFQHSENTLARTTRRFWDWLQSRIHPDEPLLIRLRSVPTIEVHHPASLSAQEARASWSEFLNRRRRRHWPWLILNTLIAPVTVLLAPLPGPNLIGYWFAYRAVRDLLAILGARRALSGQVETTFHSDEGGMAMLGSTEGMRPRCDS